MSLCYRTCDPARLPTSEPDAISICILCSYCTIQYQNHDSCDIKYPHSMIRYQFQFHSYGRMNTESCNKIAYSRRVSM